MFNKKNKISRGLRQLINGKPNNHNNGFSPVSFDDQAQRNSYLESFNQALVLDIASNPK